MIPREETSGESLYCQDAIQQILFHSFDISLLIIVLLSTNWATFIVAFGFLESLEGFKTLFMIYVCATQDYLFLKAKILVTYGARLFLIEPFE